MEVNISCNKGTKYKRAIYKKILYLLLAEDKEEGYRLQDRCELSRNELRPQHQILLDVKQQQREIYKLIHYYLYLI